MEFATIEREVFVEASPEIVFEVVSSPEHIKGWWPDEADYEATAGATGTISFGDLSDGGHIAGFTVIDVRPPHLFSFRWTQPAGVLAVEGNSLLVTFSLSPSGHGTLVKMSETGFREMGWEVAVLEETYNDHISGWDFYMPRLAPYAAGISAKAHA
ncbi:MAG: SRPBCC domain-containing protein [Actinomycetota bacterium]|nr:SRPBCC domain-containing protein [Actinomycetota bacterium]